jgi:3-hydroxyisobutyrate dehydrogenase-like beta-hydroxyacid dehydrogenase
VSTVGILHPGAMGAAVGALLREAGHDVLWASDGRSEASAERARRAGLADAGSVTALAARAEVILAICPPDAAIGLAASVPRFEGIYVDANAIAPQTARGAAAGLLAPASFVDGGIIGSPPVRAGTTRLYLSGEQAPAVARLFASGPLEAIVLPGAVGTASALKMAYAAWTKGTAALLLALRDTARFHGVDDALLAEWARSQPDLAAQSERPAASAREKGWRWEGEMREIAATFAAAGLPDGFHLAAAEVFAASPRPSRPSSS